MKKWAKKFKYLVLMASLSIFGINSCQSQAEYDSELMKPDTDAAGMNHGFNYTPLGCLLSYPWEYEIVKVDTLIDNRTYNGKTVKQIKEDLFFEPQRDGTLKYWFKSDYLVSPVDTITLADGNKSIEITRQKSKDLKIKKIYTSGKWEANFKDSTIMIHFGKNDFGLNPIKGKYYLLTAENMRIVEEVKSDIQNASENMNIKNKKYHQFVHTKF